MSTGSPSAPQPDTDAIKERQRQVWVAGDYHEIGTRVTLASELLCEAVGLLAGERVLDVASGTGNAALAASRRFAYVTSSDYAPELLDRGRARALVEGLPVIFEEADAENLPYDDASFDVVLSVFGAMFAPNHEQVASELVRVCKPGGRIGMANWTPDGFVGEQHRVLASYLPPPPGVRLPMLWGTEDHVRNLFGERVRDLRIERRAAQFRYLDARSFVSFMRSHFGPFTMVFNALDANGQERLADDLRQMAERYNRSGNETILAPGDYIEVVATRV